LFEPIIQIKSEQIDIGSPILTIHFANSIKDVQSNLSSNNKNKIQERKSRLQRADLNGQLLGHELD
jgi:hypothetical protein